MITSIYTCIYICIYKYIYNVYIYIYYVYIATTKICSIAHIEIYGMLLESHVCIYIYTYHIHMQLKCTLFYIILYIIMYIVMLYVIDNIFANHTSSSKSFAFLLKKQKHLLSGVSATGLWLNPAILLNKWQITSLGSNCQTSATADQSF